MSGEKDKQATTEPTEAQNGDHETHTSLLCYLFHQALASVPSEDQSQQEAAADRLVLDGLQVLEACYRFDVSTIEDPAKAAPKNWTELAPYLKPLFDATYQLQSSVSDLYHRLTEPKHPRLEELCQVLDAYLLGHRSRVTALKRDMQSPAILGDRWATVAALEEHMTLIRYASRELLLNSAQACGRACALDCPSPDRLLPPQELKAEAHMNAMQEVEDLMLVLMGGTIKVQEERQVGSLLQGRTLAHLLAFSSSANYRDFPVPVREGMARVRALCQGDIEAGTWLSAVQDLMNALLHPKAQNGDTDLDPDATAAA